MEKGSNQKALHAMLDKYRTELAHISELAYGRVLETMNTAMAKDLAAPEMYSYEEISHVHKRLTQLRNEVADIETVKELQASS
ncbi:MAG: hypothetical protein Q9166_003257 [cf. Caloplaca sp. 2 TL-2023]